MVYGLESSPPTSEAAGSNLGPVFHVGKLVVTCRCTVVYSAVCTEFLHL